MPTKYKRSAATIGSTVAKPLMKGTDFYRNSFKLTKFDVKRNKSIIIINHIIRLMLVCIIYELLIYFETICKGKGIKFSEHCTNCRSIESIPKYQLRWKIYGDQYFLRILLKFSFTAFLMQY